MESIKIVIECAEQNKTPTYILERINVENSSKNVLEKCINIYISLQNVSEIMNTMDSSGLEY